MEKAQYQICGIFSAKNEYFQHHVTVRQASFPNTVASSPVQCQNYGLKYARTQNII